MKIDRSAGVWAQWEIEVVEEQIDLCCFTCSPEGDKSLCGEDAEMVYGEEEIPSTEIICTKCLWLARHHPCFDQEEVMQWLSH